MSAWLRQELKRIETGTTPIGDAGWWAKLRAQAGPRPRAFPGLVAHLRASVEFYDAAGGDWVRKFTAEATEHGATVCQHAAHVYVTWPSLEAA